ncbi:MULTISPECIES: hypothetical protein [unclassified Rhizobium]|uniref:hypothetical protein n=1 Tax=unclassified Rhizobium TaxID=2613769 RepID=UPI000CDF4BF9|nr:MULTISPECIES: hypothetical protein [Rhizobium]AVA20647.1 hypothetical protein NXC24_CH00979 [Rhizobium sp. NXC24]UWU21918.1 hypothetical protein N2601_02755 [Rhizobium tropici]
MQYHFWRAFAEALDFEVASKARLDGRSGLEHEFFTVGIDENRKRLLLISKEMDPKLAALVHSDMALANPEYNVLTARPVTLDTYHIASVVSGLIGGTELDLTAFQTAAESFTNALKANPLPQGNDVGSTLTNAQKILDLAGVSSFIMPVLRGSIISGLGVSEQLVLFIRQMAAIDLNRVFVKNESNNQTISFAPMLEVDSQAADRGRGLCPVPLFELDQRDWDLFSTNIRKDDIKERLGSLGLSQYFFPPLDHAALGLIDRGIAELKTLANVAELSERIGHPIGKMEIVKGPSDVRNIVDQLHDRNLIVEGEMGFTITEAGQEMRATVKFRPREGLLFKLIDRMSIKLDTRGWFKVDVGGGKDK